MNIEYLNFYEENLEKINGGKYVVPFKDNIMDVVQSEGKIFPLVYKEFMYLTIGRPRIYDSGINSGINYAIARQQTVERLLKKHNFSIDRDFWVICELHSGQQFDFFYFDDPDAEDKDNPPVYYFDGSDLEPNETANYNNVKKVANTLEEYITSYAKAKMEYNELDSE